MKKIAIVYQQAAAPARNGIIKPKKDSGYADSGADIAYALQREGVNVVTPSAQPNLNEDMDWVFPDTHAGIQSAIDAGAEIIWLNTVLYDGHPVEEFLDKGLSVVGQNPKNVELYDDKWVTNDLLRSHGLPIPNSIYVTAENSSNLDEALSFPVVVKPIRGRGSQGVSFIKDKEQLVDVMDAFFTGGAYGDALYVEEFLPDQEVTITVMPPGSYRFGADIVSKPDFWSLPPVKRMNHENGIAPYNGVVAVIHNSALLSVEERQSADIQNLCCQCEQAAKLVGAKAPIRIDCRADKDGAYFLFDLNMKPNMTGASRPHRADQDSLTAMAARDIGWNFQDLVFNMLQQAWTK